MNLFQSPFCSRFLRRVALFAASLALTACASLPANVVRAPSAAINPTLETPLRTLTQAHLPGDGRSGFQLLPYGPNSFATRISLTKLATQSLDIQYYHLASDHTGLTLMRALRDAANPERVNDFATPCVMNLRCSVVLGQLASLIPVVG